MEIMKELIPSIISERLVEQDLDERDRFYIEQEQNYFDQKSNEAYDNNLRYIN